MTGSSTYLALGDHGDLHDIQNDTAKGLALEIALLDSQLAQTVGQQTTDRARIVALEGKVDTDVGDLDTEVSILKGRVDSINENGPSPTACQPAPHLSYHLPTGPSTTAGNWVNLPHVSAHCSFTDLLMLYFNSRL